MDARSTHISLPILPTELQDQIYHDVYTESPSRSSTPKIQAPLTPNSKTGVSLLVLPTEIRHQIYRDVFHERYIIPSFTDLTFPDPAPSYAGNRISNTSLLQTCKDLHEDALEFMYGTVTFRVLFPQGTQETLLGPSQSIIDRMKYIEVEIDMTHYLSPNVLQTVWATATNSKLMDIFYTTMLFKLSARESPGVACRVVFRHCSLGQLPWDKLPFFEALTRVPKFRTVTMELRSRCSFFCPEIDFLSAREMDFLYDNLKNELRTCLQKTIGLRRGQDNGRYRSLELHPQENVAKEAVRHMTSAMESSDEYEAGGEGAGEEDSSEEDPGDEDTGGEDSGEADLDEEDAGGEDSGEADLDEEDSGDEDCFQDWRWRDL